MSSSDFEVVWAEVATKDLEKIIEYLADKDEAAAARTLSSIEEKAKVLEQLPKRGRVVPELRKQGLRTHRELVIAPYRLIYRFDGERVFIVALIDGRRDLESLLFSRLLELDEIT